MNNTINFSLLLPTRNRIERIQTLFNSIIDTCEQPEKIEIVLYIDEDDLPSHNISHPGLRIVTHIGPRKSMGKMIQTCWENSRGRYIMLVGDDNVFRTIKWDTRVLSVFARFPDEIVLVYGNDLNQEDRMCTAPFISRTFCELTNGPCDESYPAEFIDTHIMDLFYKLRYWGLDRIVYLEDLITEHMHFVVGKAEVDATYLEKTDTENSRNVFFSLDPLRVEYAKKIVKHIKQFKRTA